MDLYMTHCVGSVEYRIKAMIMIICNLIKAINAYLVSLISTQIYKINYLALFILFMKNIFRYIDAYAESLVYSYLLPFCSLHSHSLSIFVFEN